MKILKFKNKQKFKYNKKIIVKDIILWLSVGIHRIEKLKRQKVKFNIEINTEQELKSDMKAIVSYKSDMNRIKK